MDESEEGDVKIPIFTSFSLVQDTLGVKSRHRKEWPLIGAILPSETVSGSFIRTEERQLHVSGKRVDLPPLERGKLEESILEIRERIRNGEALQVVMSHRFNLEWFNGPKILRHLLFNDKSRYVYYYKMGNLEILGSTPENAFTKHGEHLTINPIAGTRNRVSNTDANLVASLLSDNKELCEHRMLVDLARNDLSRISSTDSVNVSRSMVPEKFYSVIHLTSSVESKLAKGKRNFDIFSSLIPAGTVSGAPKVRAIEIIDEYETTERGPYGGTVGIMGKNHIDMALTIRSAFKNGGKSYTQAGAGIVKDSNPSNEVDEIIAKAGTILAGDLICA